MKLQLILLGSLSQCTESNGAAGTRPVRKPTAAFLHASQLHTPGSVVGVLLIRVGGWSSGRLLGGLRWAVAPPAGQSACQTPWWVTLSNSTATATDHCFHQIQLDSWEVLHCRNTEQQSGPSVKPSVSLLPASSLQLSEGSSSLFCLLSGYSPQGAQVSWTVDGSEVKEGVLTSVEEEKNGRYSRSSTLTLSKALWEKREVFVCTVSHDSVTLPVVLVKSHCEG
ncbi:hypothetical protein MHYP_G00169820 [Metynnis hypsauchen]